MSQWAKRPARARIIGSGLLFLTLGGCGAGGTEAVQETAAAPLFVPDLPPPDGLLGSPELQAVVDLQTRRDGEALRAFLADPDPAVRARAALALASVQDPRAEGALASALLDEDPSVRRDVAFALGQIPWAESGALVVRALELERDPEVRLRLVEAIGKRGDRTAVRALLEPGPAPDEGAPWVLSLARAALREIRPPGLLTELFSRLTDADPAVRFAAAYYFGRSSNTTPWRPEGARLRTVLDGYEWDEPAATYLVTAVGRLVETGEDAERLVRWLREGVDWRARANVAAAVLHPTWLESRTIRDALFAALSDPSEHVRVAAAASIALALWNLSDDRERGAEIVRGPVEEWRVQMAILPPLAQQGFESLALDWTRRMASHHPVPTARGIELLANHAGTEVTEFLFELADHAEPEVRAAATTALSRRWLREGGTESDALRHLDLFVRLLGDVAPLPVARAAGALAHPALLALGGNEALQNAFEGKRAEGDPNTLVPLIEAMGPSSTPLLRTVLSDPDPTLRRAAAAALERVAGTTTPEAALGPARVERAVDWVALAGYGAEPRVRIVTERGDIIVRLTPEQAPMSVEAFLGEVARGAHDGVRFHRVVSNFVIQGGDVGLGDGTGSAGYELRTEITLLPFERGVLGMASAGKDTEGSQFFLTHSAQPHLEGGYTAFGWIETGGEVLDRLLQGDRVVRMTIEVAAGT
ncbi:MAG: HEAT repeat domain-containing protein [Gemmatimonadota bacterium]